MTFLCRELEMVGNLRMSKHNAIKACVGGEGSDDLEAESLNVEREEMGDGGCGAGDANMSLEDWV